jgi:hypothetical protein
MAILERKTKKEACMTKMVAVHGDVTVVVVMTRWWVMVDEFGLFITM